MKSIKKIIVYITPYSLLFFIFSFVFLTKVIHSEKTLLWNPDGIGQHFVSFVYLCNYLDNIINFNSVSFFDFRIGQGADIITTLSSYDFTDPICLISSLLYPFSIESRYIVMLFVKLYLIGISFLLYCVSIELKSKTNNTIGAIAYVFSGFIVFYFARHPNFIHYAYYAPLIFAGIELFIRKNKYHILLFSLFFNILANFYCAYIDCLLIIFYVLILNYYRIFVYKTSSFLKEFYVDMRLFLICLASIFLSAFILLPTFYSYTINGRLNTTTGFTDSFLFFPVNHYVEYIFNLFIPSIYHSSAHIGMNIFSIFSIIYCSIKNRNIYLTYLIIFVLMSCIPFFGLLFNGFGYVSHRWTFVIPFFSSILIVVAINNIDNIDEKTWRNTHFFILLFMLTYCFLPEADYNTQALFMAIILFIEYFMFKIRKIILSYFVVFAGVIFSIYFTFFTPGKEYISQFSNLSTLDNYFVDSSSMASGVDNNFFRVEKYESDQISCNTSIFNNIFGVSLRWSIIPYYVKNFYTYLGFSTTIGNCIFLGLDNRTIPLTLAGVKYYTCPIKPNIKAPYGFEFLTNNSMYAIFKNKYNLPIAYFYDTTFDELQLPKNDPLAIENIMLNCAIVESSNNVFDNKFQYNNNNKIQYTFNNFHNITLKNNEIHVLDNDNFYEIVFNPINTTDKEVFVMVNDVDLISTNDQVVMSIEYESIFGNTHKIATISNNRYFWHTDNSNIVFNIGNNIGNITKIRLYFDKKCIVKYKNLKIITRESAKYRNAILKLKQDLPFEIFFKNDSLHLKVNSQNDKILQFSIPFSEGWEGYIDNRKTKIFRSNIMYTAMFVDKGFHEIKLVYHTPFLKIGIIISLITFLFIIIIYIKSRLSRCG